MFRGCQSRFEAHLSKSQIWFTLSSFPNHHILNDCPSWICSIYPSLILILNKSTLDTLYLHFLIYRSLRSFPFDFHYLPLLSHLSLNDFKHCNYIINFSWNFLNLRIAQIWFTDWFIFLLSNFLIWTIAIFYLHTLPFHHFINLDDCSIWFYITKGGYVQQVKGRNLSIAQLWFTLSPFPQLY